MQTRRLLLADDDSQFGLVLKAYLEQQDFEVTYCINASDTMQQLQSSNFDLLILDLTLPDEDGLCLLRKLHYQQHIPVIIISGRSTDEDRIVGLELGADDYIVKPFSPRELTLRIEKRLSLNAAPQVAKNPSKIKVGPWLLDLEGHDVTHESGEHVELTSREFMILKTLASNPRKVMSREQLIDACMSSQAPESNRAVDILISRIRGKLETDPKHPEFLLTVKGFGYKLLPDATA